jgi:hypothetical protein
LLVGFDGGEIQQMRFDPSIRKLSVVKSFQSHAARVNDLKYNRSRNQFVSCGNDHAILLQAIDPSD